MAIEVLSLGVAVVTGAAVAFSTNLFRIAGIDYWKTARAESELASQVRRNLRPLRRNLIRIVNAYDKPLEKQCLGFVGALNALEAIKSTLDSNPTPHDLSAFSSDELVEATRRFVRDVRVQAECCLKFAYMEMEAAGQRVNARRTQELHPLPATAPTAQQIQRILITRCDSLLEVLDDYSNPWKNVARSLLRLRRPPRLQWSDRGWWG